MLGRRSPRFYGGAPYENSRSAEEKEAFRYALHKTMDLWCAHAAGTPIAVPPMLTKRPGRW